MHAIALFLKVIVSALRIRKRCRIVAPVGTTFFLSCIDIHEAFFCQITEHAYTARLLKSCTCTERLFLPHLKQEALYLDQFRSHIIVGTHQSRADHAAAIRDLWMRYGHLLRHADPNLTTH